MTASADSGVSVDPHVKILDEDVVRRAKRRDIDVLVYAPHFTNLPTIRERADRFSDDDLLVVPGRELFTGSWRDRKHVLGVGLDAPIPDFITLSGAMRELDRQDAAVLVPHPTFLTVSLDAADIDTYRSVIDAVEPYNTKHWPHQNRRARRIVAESDLPPFLSSYAHLHGTVGEAWTTFDTEVTSADDLVAAFDEEVPRTVHRRTGLVHRARCIAEFFHNVGWEDTWQKVDRVFLSGMEATHPDHEVYEGRFDDVAVY